MKTALVIKIAALGIIIVLLLYILIAGITGSLNLFNRINIPFYSASFNETTAGNYNSGNASVSPDDVHSIEIEWVEGNIDVIVQDTDAITFEETINMDIDEKYKMHYTFENGVLKLMYNKGNIKFFNRYPRLKKNLTIIIPGDLKLKEFDIEGVSSDINIGAIYADSFEVDGISGRLNIDGVTAGDIKVQGVSGKTEIINSFSKDFELDGISGSVNIKNCDFENITCDLVSGNIFLQPGANAKNIDISTISSSMRISLPESKGFTAMYSIGTGSFNSDYPVDISNRRAVYGDGSTKISVDSVSGSLHIEGE